MNKKEYNSPKLRMFALRQMSVLMQSPPAQGIKATREDYEKDENTSTNVVVWD